MEETISQNTTALLRYAETAKSLRVDTDELATKIGQKLLTTNAALTSEFENDLINSVNEKILNVKKLNKNVYLSQRLSDLEKTNLLKLFSPPYKLIFSDNPTDIGSHMYYRSLNEIATFRCYDLLPADTEIPEGYDMLIKEVGASIPKIIKYMRKHVHACTPNLSLDDTIRITNTAHTLNRITNTENKKRNYLSRQYYNNNPLYRCYNKSQHCFTKAPYVIFAHSSYDNSLTALANIMESSNAVLGIGFIHFSSKILSQLNKGSDNGLNWKVFLRNKVYFIEFWFDNDYQNSYVHNLDTYLGIIKCSVCKSRKNTTYIIQRREEIGGLLFYNIIKPIVDIPPTFVFRQIPFSDQDNIIVHYYKLQNNPSKFFYHELIPIKIVVPKKFFEKLYFYLETLPDGKFTIQNSLIFASTLANRTIINGSYVSAPFNLEIDQVDNIAYATYFIVYCRRYDMISVLSKLKGFEDIKRNQGFFNKIKTLFMNLRDIVYSARFSKFIPEENFDDIIANMETQIENDEMLNHSKNLLQWLAKLWRINPKYDVKFYPITRVVSVEEDIAVSKSVINVLPTVFQKEVDDGLLQYISDSLGITRVNEDLCSITDIICNSDLTEVNNKFEKHCVFRSLANSLNLTFEEVVETIKNSEHYANLMPTNKLKITQAINEGACDYDIFEFLAIEFNINICLHMGNVTKFFNVGSLQIRHFRINDKHCTQLVERFSMPTVTFELKYYKPFDKQEKLDSELKQYLSSDEKKLIKFNSYQYKIDNIYPFPCKSFLKLMEIDNKYGVISNGKVFELSAAPGSWIKYVQLYHSQSQIIYSYFRDGLEMNIDTDEMICLNEFSNGNILDEDIAEDIFSKLSDLGGADTFLSDIAIMNDDDTLNITAFERYIFMVSNTLPHIMSNGGNVVLKVFTDISFGAFNPEVFNHFEKIIFVKPQFSNPLSSEYYIVMLNFDIQGKFNNHNICDYNMHTPIKDRQLIHLIKGNKRIFGKHKEFTMPIIYNPKTEVVKEIKEEIVEFKLPEPEEILDSVSTTNFECDLTKIGKKLQFSMTEESGIEVIDTLNSQQNADVKIEICKNKIISTSDGIGTEFYKLTDSELVIDISLYYENELDIFSKLTSVFTHFQTFKLKYTVITQSLNYPEVERKLFDFVSQYQNTNKIYFVSNINPDRNSNSISKFEKSISEYISYCNTLNAINTNTYHYHYEQLAMNNFNPSQTMLANLQNDTQNISIRSGKTYIYKHPKAKEDEYSHFFDGVSFVPNSNLQDNVVNLVGDYCHRMFDAQIVDKLKQINLDDLKNVEFHLIQGVAGHGKTREIVQKHRPNLKSNKVKQNRDLVLSPTKAGRQVLFDRTCLHKNINASNLDPSYYKTITSFLLNPNKNSVAHLYIDEVMMVHSALILAVSYYSKAAYVFMYGDTCQIPFHSAIGDFSFAYNNPLSLFKISEVRDKSYRIPVDVAAVLNPIYLENHNKFGINKGIKTSSVTLRSVEIVKINSVNEMKKYKNPDFKFLTFTHTTENELQKLDAEFEPSTIASYQGSEAKRIAIVRTSPNVAELIYQDIHLCITAMTRHTHQLIYYTTCDKDQLSMLIKNALLFTEHALKRFSTSFGISGINSDVIPVYETASNNHKFFVSTNKMPKSYILFDHEKYSNEREIVSAVNLLSAKTKKVIIFKKDIFRQFDMNMLRKYFYKFSPSIKSMIVKISNTTFEENEDVKDIVENYKCTNVIQNSIAENLVPVVEPYFPEVPKIETYIQISPSLEMLQLFISHLFPQCCFVNTTLDSYFVQNSDIEYTLSNVSICLLKDQPKIPVYDKLKPVLSTPCPNIRDCTQREIILGIQKRNLNPPELIMNSSPDLTSDHLIQNFCTKLCIPNFDKVIIEMENVRVTTRSVVSWLEKQDRVVLKQIQSDIPFILTSLSDCALSLKRSPKIRITPDSIDVYDSVQTITYHPKFINAYFCSLVDQIQDRIMKCLMPFVLFNTKVNLTEFNRKCTLIYKKYNKLFLFAGDDSLLINKFKFKEMDMSKFDKSQLLFALNFLCKLFEIFGMSRFDSQLYFEMMYYRICRDPMNKVTMFLTPQMESGCAATFLGNTCFCAAVISSCLDFDDFSYTPQMEKFSLTFNLETKEFSYKFPYFCSKFLIISEEEFKFVPDPVKILIKLGRRDLVNYSHLNEFHISLLDLISIYDNECDFEVLAMAISERYLFPYNCAFHIRNLVSVIKTKDLFKSLYYTLPEDILNKNMEKFPDYF